MAKTFFLRQISEAKRFRDTAGGGPEWKSVIRRTTYDAIAGSMLEDVAYPADECNPGVCETSGGQTSHD